MGAWCAEHVGCVAIRRRAARGVCPQGSRVTTRSPGRSSQTPTICSSLSHINRVAHRPSPTPLPTYMPRDHDTASLETKCKAHEPLSSVAYSFFVKHHDVRLSVMYSVHRHIGTCNLPNVSWRCGIQPLDTPLYIQTRIAAATRPSSVRERLGMKCPL